MATSQRVVLVLSLVLLAALAWVLLTPGGGDGPVRGAEAQPAATEDEDAPREVAEGAREEVTALDHPAPADHGDTGAAPGFFAGVRQALAASARRQEWDRWPLDIVFPMVYHGFYREPVEWIEDATAEGVAALPPAVPLVAGLYLPDLTPATLGTAMRAARRGGATGVAFFELGGLRDEHLEVVRQVLSDREPA